MNKWNFKKYFFCAFVEKMTCIVSVREIREVVLLVKSDLSYSLINISYDIISLFYLKNKINI